MKPARASSFIGICIAAVLPAFAQSGNMTLPKTVDAGSAFSVQTSGSGNASLYVVGLGQVLKHDIQLGGAAYFPEGSLFNAGRYTAFLSAGSSSTSGEFDVVPLAKPTDLSFLAKPSRLPVSLHDGITGAVYVFDTYRNLITNPLSISFALTNPVGATQTRTIPAREGAAWTTMDSSPQQGTDKFVAQAGDVNSSRVIRQVPGDPCGLRMSLQQSGQHVQLQTDPVRDCSGNAVPDGTIVTFTEAFNGAQSTVDVPVKRGIAQVQFPVHEGATISVASGVALGNQIHLEK
jgi:hypothetical protein